MQDRVDLQRENRYRVGSVTYEVAACFDDGQEPLHDIVRRLLLDDIHRDPGRKFAGNTDSKV